MKFFSSLLVSAFGCITIAAGRKSDKEHVGDKIATLGALAMLAATQKTMAAGNYDLPIQNFLGHYINPETYNVKIETEKSRRRCFLPSKIVAAVTSLATIGFFIVAAVTEPKSHARNKPNKIFPISMLGGLASCASFIGLTPLTYFIGKYYSNKVILDDINKAIIEFISAKIPSPVVPEGDYMNQYMKALEDLKYERQAVLLALGELGSAKTTSAASQYAYEDRHPILFQFHDAQALMNESSMTVEGLRNLWRITGMSGATCNAERIHRFGWGFAILVGMNRISIAEQKVNALKELYQKSLAMANNPQYQSPPQNLRQLGERIDPRNAIEAMQPLIGG